jgi:hypothetical protein
MIVDRLLIAALCCWLGVAGLLPTDPTVPPTPAQMQMQYKFKQLSNICDKKKKSHKVQEMCKKWKSS